MPANIQSSQNMLLSTDYPLDKIIFQFETSVTLAAFGTADIYTPHNLSDIPLVNGFWTTDSTWNLAYEMTTGNLLNGSPKYSTGINADKTNVHFSVNNNTGSPVTIYYRVYGFPPFSNDNFDAGPTNIINNFKLSTDYNYPKLYNVGSATQPSTSGNDVSVVVYNHNLGYIPQVQAWVNNAGVVAPIMGFVETSATRVQVDETRIIVTFNSFATSTVYWRLYLDVQT